MDFEHNVPILQCHFLNDFSQDARVVHKNIDSTKRIYGGLNNAPLRPQGLIQRLFGDCLGAKGFQFLDDRIGRIAGAATINAAAQVVDDDFGSALGYSIACARPSPPAPVMTATLPANSLFSITGMKYSSCGVMNGRRLPEIGALVRAPLDRWLIKRRRSCGVASVRASVSLAGEAGS